MDLVYLFFKFSLEDPYLSSFFRSGLLLLGGGVRFGGGVYFIPAANERSALENFRPITEERVLRRVSIRIFKISKLFQRSK
jgi:hypothetical protein